MSLLPNEMVIGGLYQIQLVDAELGFQKTLEETKAEGSLFLNVYGRYKGETDDYYIFAVVEYSRDGKFDPFKAPKGAITEIHPLEV